MGRTTRALFHTGIYMAGLLISRGAAVLLIPIYTRIIDPASFALWDLCTTAVLFIAPVFNLGMSSAVLRYYFHFETFPERRRVYNTSVCFLLLVLIPSITLLFLFAPVFSGWLFDDRSHADLFRLSVLLAAFTAFSQQPMSLLRSQQKSTLFSALQFVRALAGPSISILLVVVLHWGINGMLWGETAGLAALTFAGFIVSWRWIGVALDGKLLKPMLAFGLPLLPVGIGTALLAVSDRFILRQYIGLEAMAPYSLGFKIGMCLNVLIQALQLAWQPAALEISTHSDGKTVLARSTHLLQFPLFAMAMALTCAAPELVRVFAPETGYAGAEYLIPWIAFSYALHGFVFVLSTGLGIAERTGWASIVFCTAGLAKVGMAFALIPHYGTLGAAVSTLIAFGLEFVLTFFVTQWVYPLPLKTGRLLLPFGISFVCAGAAMMTFALPWTVSIPVRGGILLLFGVAWYYGALGAGERTALRDTVVKIQSRIHGRLRKS